MVLHQDGRYVPQRVVAGGVPGATDVRTEAFLRMGVVQQVDVRSQAVAAIAGRFHDPVHGRFHPGGQGRGGLRRLHEGVGQHPVVMGAVGDVVVHVQVRAPAVEQFDDVPGLQAVQLQVVPVQVQSCGVGPEAHAFHRTVLCRPPVRRDPFMAIHVVDREDQQDGAVQQFLSPAQRHVPEDHQGCVLAVDFACMDAVLDQDDRLAGGGGSCRSERMVPGDDHQRHIPTLAGGAEAGQLHLRQGGFQLLQVPNRLVVGTGGTKVVGLGPCQPLRRDFVGGLGPKRDEDNHEKR